MGGCCGEPVDETSPDANNRTIANTGQVVTQQPGAQQGLQWQEKSVYQPPNVPTPPPALQYGQPTGNGFVQNMQNIQNMQQMQQAQWPQNNVVSQGQFNPYSHSPSPPPGVASTITNGSYNNAAAFPPSQSPSSFGGNTVTNSYAPPHSPPLTQPSPAHTYNGPMTVTMSVAGRQGGPGVTPAPDSFIPPSTDEGKLSVSIDFGE